MKCNFRSFFARLILSIYVPELNIFVGELSQIYTITYVLCPLSNLDSVVVSMLLDVFRSNTTTTEYFDRFDVHFFFAFRRIFFLLEAVLRKLYHFDFFQGEEQTCCSWSRRARKATLPRPSTYATLRGPAGPCRPWPPPASSPSIASSTRTRTRSWRATGLSGPSKAFFPATRKKLLQSQNQNIYSSK